MEKNPTHFIPQYNLTSVLNKDHQLLQEMSNKPVKEKDGTWFG